MNQTVRCGRRAGWDIGHVERTIADGLPFALFVISKPLQENDVFDEEAIGHCERERFSEYMV